MTIDKTNMTNIMDTHAVIKTLQKEYELPVKTAEGMVYAIQQGKPSSNIATKSDIKDMATKSDITRLEAKMATKDDIKDMATKSDITKLEVKMATKDDIKDMATKSDIGKLEKAMIKMEKAMIKMELHLLVKIAIFCSIFISIAVGIGNFVL